MVERLRRSSSQQSTCSALPILTLTLDFPSLPGPIKCHDAPVSFRVKNQLTTLIIGNIRAIANIERRLRNGIFDPEADKRDFEEYLRYGIGRTAQDTESELERLKRMDNQFERLEHDHQTATETTAQLQTYLETKKDELERLKNCDDCTKKDRDIERLSFEIAKFEEKLIQSQADVNRLFDLKAKRAEAILSLPKIQSGN